MYPFKFWELFPWPVRPTAVRRLVYGAGGVLAHSCAGGSNQTVPCLPQPAAAGPPAPRRGPAPGPSAEEPAGGGGSGRARGAAWGQGAAAGRAADLAATARRPWALARRGGQGGGCAGSRGGGGRHTAAAAAAGHGGAASSQLPDGTGHGAAPRRPPAGPGGDRLHRCLQGASGFGRRATREQEAHAACISCSGTCLA